MQTQQSECNRFECLQRHDGVSPNLNTIEILIVPQGRQLIRGYAAKLADGQLNEALNELRKAAKREQP